ncbi:PAS domain S-box protein, partial [bacterium]|nr:PAS domain S-box protein [bacterium]
LLRMNVSDLYEFPEERAPLLEKIASVGSMVHEIRYRKKDGTKIVTLDTFVAVKKTDSGKVLYFDGFMEDITKRKQAEEQLRESEEFGATLLSNSPNPIMVINPDTSIRYVNPAFERLTDFSSAELIGSKLPYPWWMGKDRHKTATGWQQVMRRKARRQKGPFRKKSGELFWVELASVPVRADGKLKYYLLNWIDITEQKRLRDNMQFYIGQVTKVQEEERRRIARELHDDTIQALSVLYSDIDEAKMMEEQLPVELVSRLAQIQASLHRVIEDVRCFSHKLRPGLLDRLGLIPSIELLIAEVKKSGLSCYLKIIGSQRRLSSDTELILFRITQEALSNVRKHARATEAQIKIEFAKETIKLSVIDNGRGFQVPKVVDNYARRGKLGLIGIRERVRLIDGSFHVESNLGKGTSITVELPA